LKKLFLLLLVWGTAHCVERVTAFHSDIHIAANGSLTVTETIEVQAEGKQIRRGILRDFPTDYRDRFGNRVTVPLEVLKVTRNGAPESFALERLSNGTRIRIGEASRNLQPGKHVYSIVYGSARQIGFFDRHDELYWNVNGTGWTLAFDRITAEVWLPARVPAGDIKVEAFTGPQGARGHDFNAFVRHGSAAFRATRPLAPGEGMTISVAFPKGVVAQPSGAARAGSFLADNKGTAAGIAAWVLMFAFLFACWWRYGRDPKPGPLFPRYEPPAGLGPGGVRYVDRRGYDGRCLAAALLGLASRGYLRIRRNGGSYELERIGKQTDFRDGERELAAALFRDQDERVAFGGAYSATMEKASGSFAQALAQHLARGVYWSENGGYAAIAVLTGCVGVIAMFLLNASALAMVAVVIAMLATVFFFAWKLLPVVSVEARKLQDQIDGLRQYLSVAEKDDLERMKAPPQTKEEFSRFLPYAVALGVEKTWADRFAATLGVAAVAAAVSDFYQSDSDADFGVSHIVDLTSDLGGTIASASTPPGSSSGFSDSGSSSSSDSGGSSGGGGGGGGGSGW
jgi:uncharacterized membrane protein YgcG